MQIIVASPHTPGVLACFQILYDDLRRRKDPPLSDTAVAGLHIA